MSKVKTTSSGQKIFKYPGCDGYHSLRVNDGVSTKHPHWGFNGDHDKPTFTPSILATVDWEKGREICYSFVTDGRIQFLSDCTHKLAGQTVEIPEWPHAPRQYGGLMEGE